MHIISPHKLRQFWQRYPDSESSLRAWIKHVKRSDWNNFADVRANYPQADQVGRLTVFNIAGNKYRLVVANHLNRGKVFVRHILTHSDYDSGHWKKDA
jgi:mRNA interferase HigB